MSYKKLIRHYARQRRLIVISYLQIFMSDGQLGESMALRVGMSLKGDNEKHLHGLIKQIKAEIGP